MKKIVTSTIKKIYIALDKHTIENGCLKIVPNSHKEGELEFEDCVGNFTWGHKRRLSSKSMDFLYNKYGIKNVLMEPGDILFFNHLLAHGSTSNIINLPRRAIVLQATSIFEKDNNLITFVEWPELVKDIQEKVIVLKFNYENELNNRSVEITGID